MEIERQKIPNDKKVLKDFILAPITSQNYDFHMSSVNAKHLEENPPDFSSGDLEGKRENGSNKCPSHPLQIILIQTVLLLFLLFYFQNNRRNLRLILRLIFQREPCLLKADKVHILDF